MTDAVKAVGTTATGISKTVEVKETDGQYRRSKLDAALSKALLKNKEARKNFREDMTAVYKEEIGGFSNRDAKKTAKLTLQNERAAASVDNTMLYIDQAKYEAAKAANPNVEHVLIKDKKILNMISDNQEDFYNTNGFSSDLTKKRLGMYTGFDNKLNLDEKSAGADNYGVSKGKFKKAAKLAGYDIEKDLTYLYKTLALLGVAGATAGVGAAFGIPFTSNVIPMNADGSPITDPKLLAQMVKPGQTLTYTKDGYPIIDTIKSVGGRGLPGTLKGLMGGLVPGLALAAVVKDNGGKDVFKGLSAEAIVEKGTKNLDHKILGKRNQKLMKEILTMENLTKEDKAYALQLAYGELTGKKVNDREMAAAYEIANFLNLHPEIKAKDYDKISGEEKVEEVAEEVVEEVVEEAESKPVIEELCALTPEDITKVETKEVPVHKYKPKKGEYWLSIVAAKYGISGEEGLEVVHELKRLHGITDFRKNVQPSTMNLPEVIKLGDKEYKLNPDKEVTQKTDKFAPAQKYTGTFTNPFTKVEVQKYIYKDCHGKASPEYASPKERNEQMRIFRDSNPKEYKIAE